MKISNNGIKYLTKAMGTIALAATTIDVCETGKKNAIQFKKDGEAEDAIRSNIKASRMDFASPMYSRMKEKSAKMYPHNLMNCGHMIKGFISGASQQTINHAALIGSSIFALCVSKRKAQIASGVLLTCVSLYNVIKHGTGLMEEGRDLE